MNDNFCHLHNHSSYSLLDGAARIDDMIKACVEMGMPAIAVSDHGNMHGAFELHKKAKDAGINGIVGLEAYTTPSGTHRSVKEKVLYGDGGEDDVAGGGAYHHQTMWAYDTRGLHNLFRLSSLSSIEGMYRKPRIDSELLSQYGSGLIVTTGCPSGLVQTRLRRGEYQAAREAAGEMQDVFGFDNVFLEIMDHGLEIESRVKKDLLRLSKDLRLPLVATNDAHYVSESDAVAHDALLCVQVGRQLSDRDRFRFSGSGYYLKSAAEMRSVFREIPEACDNTLAIAARCDVRFAEGVNHMPRFACPEGETEDSWLRKEAFAGLSRRGLAASAVAVERLEHELSIIEQMGFPGYFLVVADLINWAKAQGIRVGPGRGSAAGSLVAFSTGITDISPLDHGLLFARFLNENRVSPPDVDIDFDERRRDEVLGYVKGKYGTDYVAQIVTFGGIKSRSAVKDATRVLGHEASVGQVIVGSMPMVQMGKDVSLVDIFDPKHDRYRDGGVFRQHYGTDPRMREIVDLARGLEGLIRSTGVHAAGVIMSDVPLLEVVPLSMRASDGAIITQFEMYTCEKLGLLKVDFLGLRNLTIIEDALANIRYTKGLGVVLEDLPLDDRATYELLASGDTLGVFQLDGGPMRGLLKAMEPDNFNDISAVLALYRPGPMGADSHTNYADRKTGRQAIVPIHPELAEPLAEILDETYGLIVYQEQIMSIAQKVAGYSLSQADLLRRAMGKKKKEILDAEYEPFAAGMLVNGYSADAVATLWDIMVPFSDYAFNKAHSAAYGLISYWTAWLKAHHPVEYLAALLTSVSDKPEKKPEYLLEAQRMGVPILPPSVNTSLTDYTPDGRSIRFGLQSIRGIGAPVVAEIVSTRQEGGPFTGLADYLSRVPSLAGGKRAVEALIKAGAMDTFGQTRRALMLTAERVGDPAAKGLWLGDSGERIAVESAEWEDRMRLAFEREMLGQTVSDKQPDRFRPVVVRLPARRCDTETLTQLGQMLEAHPGPIPVHLHVVEQGRTSVLQLEATVNPNPALRYWLSSIEKANVIVRQTA